MEDKHFLYVISLSEEPEYNMHEINELLPSVLHRWLCNETFEFEEKIAEMFYEAGNSEVGELSAIKGYYERMYLHLINLMLISTNVELFKRSLVEYRVVNTNIDINGDIFLIMERRV